MPSGGANRARWVMAARSDFTGSGRQKRRLHRTPTTGDHHSQSPQSQARSLIIFLTVTAPFDESKRELRSKALRER